MNRSLDACRWVYNKTLEARKAAWEERKESLSYYTAKRLIPVWKQDNPFLNDAYSQCLQQAAERVDLAYRAFFKRNKDGAGYPRFKGWRYYRSFTYTQSGFAVHGDCVKLSKIGYVAIELHRPIEGVVKTATVSRDRLNRWYVSFSCEVEARPLPPTDKVVGVDLGLATFATFSDDSEPVERQRFFKRDEKALKRMQRRIQAAAKGSPERKKLVRALNHIHERVANRRRDFAHKAARELVNRYQLIVFEDLSVKDMQADNFRSMNRSIADAAWSQFVGLTETKAKEAGRTVVKVQPRNTTQSCSGCGEIVRKSLSERQHNCSHCGLSLSRDENAARNILARGLASIGSQTVEAPEFIRGE